MLMLNDFPQSDLIAPLHAESGGCNVIILERDDLSTST